MTFDPRKSEVVAYLDGTATAAQITDPVANDVDQYRTSVSSNPYHFPWPIYLPRSFVLKFNGDGAKSSGIYEHWLMVDTEKRLVTYGRASSGDAEADRDYRVKLDVRRSGKSLLAQPLVFAARDKASIELPGVVKIIAGDEIITSLEAKDQRDWRQVGTDIRYRIREGAPFTFGRALGLGNEPMDHGTQLFVDGVAVFNRVLSGAELGDLSFSNH